MVCTLVNKCDFDFDFEKTKEVLQKVFALSWLLTNAIILISGNKERAQTLLRY
jgi:hypothetical protein